MNHSAAEVAAARALFTRAVRKASPVVVPLSAAGADEPGEKPALFCIHSIVGAGATDFLPLARNLGENLRVFGVQAPLQRMADPSFGASVHALADIYADAIVESQPSGAVVVAGWSAGAAIAIEVAHSLRARGREVALLVAIDGAPEVAVGLRPWDPRYWIGVAVNLPAWAMGGRAIEKPAEVLARWGRSIVKGIGQVGSRRTSEAAPRLQRLVDLSRYSLAERQFMVRLYNAIMDYAPQPWDGPVVVYQARAVLSLPQYVQRWRSVAPMTERAVMEGNHVTIMSEPRVANLARDLQARIATALAAPT